MSEYQDGTICSSSRAVGYTGGQGSNPIGVAEGESHYPDHPSGRNGGDCGRDTGLRARVGFALFLSQCVPFIGLCTVVPQLDTLAHFGMISAGSGQQLGNVVKNLPGQFGSL